MQLSFNSMINNTNKTQNVSPNRAVSTVSSVSSTSQTSTNQRKSFDELLLSTSSTANTANVASSVNNSNSTISTPVVNSAKQAIVSDVKAPKSQEFLDNLKADIEAGNYEIDVNKLAKNLVNFSYI